MRRVVQAKRVDSVSRDEFKHAITWEMLTRRAGLKFGGNYKIINTANLYILISNMDPRRFRQFCLIATLFFKFMACYMFTWLTDSM
jgi:hypothetical protein